MTVVLVHGCGTDRRFWDTLRPHLEGIEILSPSLPGRDGNTGAAPTSAAAAARWLREWMRARDVIDATVVGHSYGGAIAIELALHELDADPPQLAGLVLVSTGARLRVAPPILEGTRAAVQTGMPLDLAQYAYLPGTDRELVAHVEALARRTPVEATAADWNATDGFDRMHDVAAIRLPTLVVCGTDDVLTPPKYGEYLARMIPGAQLERVAGAGHMLPIEHAAALAPLVRRFVDARAVVTGTSA
jgi:pimeloyl-ACP methyl ester carboxylesterase